MIEYINIFGRITKQQYKNLNSIEIYYKKKGIYKSKSQIIRDAIDLLYSTYKDSYDNKRKS